MSWQSRHNVKYKKSWGKKKNTQITNKSENAVEKTVTNYL